MCSIQVDLSTIMKRKFSKNIIYTKLYNRILVKISRYITPHLTNKVFNNNKFHSFYLTHNAIGFNGWHEAMIIANNEKWHRGHRPNRHLSSPVSEISYNHLSLSMLLPVRSALYAALNGPAVVDDDIFSI